MTCMLGVGWGKWLQPMSIQQEQPSSLMGERQIKIIVGLTKQRQLGVFIGLGLRNGASGRPWFCRMILS